MFAMIEIIVRPCMCVVNDISDFGAVQYGTGSAAALAVTKRGDMIWPTGLAGRGSWACDVFVEFVLAVAATNRKDH